MSNGSVTTQLLTAASRLLNHSRGAPADIQVAADGARSGPLRYGMHSHDDFEVFFIWGAAMRFEVRGQPRMDLPSGTVMIVPPGILHVAAEWLPQRKRLRELAITVGDRAERAVVALHQGQVQDEMQHELSAEETAHWTTLLGESPAAFVKRIRQAVAEGTWGRQRALGLVRTLLAAVAETIAYDRGHRPTVLERKVRSAATLIESGYYEPKLTVAAIARKVGASPSHLAAGFRQITGGTVHHALLDVRLRRSMELLVQGHCSVKEVAALTGWSSPFHFSNAFRKRYGAPPLAFLNKSIQ